MAAIYKDDPKTSCREVAAALGITRTTTQNLIRDCNLKPLRQVPAHNARARRRAPSAIYNTVLKRYCTYYLGNTDNLGNAECARETYSL